MRPLFAVIAVCLFALPSLQAQEGQVLGKSTPEWLQILREHPQANYRRAALIALETLGARQRGVVPGLMEALEKDREAKIRAEAALVLGRMGPDAKGAAAALAQILAKDPDDAVRQAAATALGNNLLPEAGDFTATLAKSLGDKHAGTRAAALETLHKLGEQAKPALDDVLVLAKNRSEDATPRALAIQMLSRWAADRAEVGTALVEILNDKQADVLVRGAAAEGLGRMGAGGAPAVAALGQALGDKNLDLRKATAIGLSSLGSKSASAWPAIKTALTFNDTENTPVRYQLVRAAGAMARDEPEAIPALVEVATKDSAVQNCLPAIQELGELGAAAKDAVPALQRLLRDDGRAAIREAADAALKKIQPEPKR